MSVTLLMNGYHSFILCYIVNVDDVTNEWTINLYCAI